MEAAINAEVPSKHMHLKQVREIEFAESVLMWLKQAREQNLPVISDLIKEKAMKLAELMHIPYFMAIYGCLKNYKRRHSITFRRVQGETGVVKLKSTSGSLILTREVFRRRRFEPGRDWTLLAVAFKQDLLFSAESSVQEERKKQTMYTSSDWDKHKWQQEVSSYGDRQF